MKDSQERPATARAEPVAASRITLTVNGTRHEIAVEPWTTLLDLLRETLELSGTKKGCDQGQCGACTVLVDGRRVNACLQLAIMRDGCHITTVEGLAAADGTLSALQQAFIAHDAFQCGYCTPGQLCSATALLEESRASGEALTPEVIRERMSGNLCRCGAYTNIADAVEDVARQMAPDAQREAA